MLAIGKPLTANQRLFKATTDIIGRDEFIALAGVLMVGTKQVVDGLPTACTNGRDEMYGREFVDSLTDAELRFLMLHECYHKMYRHLTTWRHLYEIDARRANQACDYVINHKLVNTDAGKSGWIVMPKGGCYDDKYAGMNAKEVFDLLDQQSDDDDTTIIRQAIDFTINVITRHHIDDDIGAFTIGKRFDYFRKIFSAIVDAAFCAQTFASATFIIRTCRSKHPMS